MTFTLAAWSTWVDLVLVTYKRVRERRKEQLRILASMSSINPSNPQCSHCLSHLIFRVWMWLSVGGLHGFKKKVEEFFLNNVLSWVFCRTDFKYLLDESMLPFLLHKQLEGSLNKISVEMASLTMRLSPDTKDNGDYGVALLQYIPFLWSRCLSVPNANTSMG